MNDTTEASDTEDFCLFYEWFSYGNREILVLKNLNKNV